MNLRISTQKSKNLKSPTTPNEFKRETELPNKVFFYNYLIGVQKPKGFFDKETQDLNKEQPIYHFIQQEKTSIECIQFHGETIFVGTTKGIWVLFRRARDTIIATDEDFSFPDDENNRRKWSRLDAKQYNPDQYGEKKGFIREFKMAFSLTDHFVTHIELDREKNVIVVLTKGKVADIYAARYDPVRGYVSHFQKIQMLRNEVGKSIEKLKEISSFTLQKASDESINPYSDRTRYLAILCKGGIYRARVKMTKENDINSEHTLVEFKKRIQFNADPKHVLYMEYAGEYICLSLRTQYCVFNEKGDMLFVSGKSLDSQEKSIFTNWTPNLDDKDHLFRALVNVIGTDRNIVDVDWGSNALYCMAFNDPFVVSSEGPLLKYYTPYFQHGNKIVSTSDTYFQGNIIRMLCADEHRIIAASTDGVWEILQPSDKMKQLKAIITIPTYSKNGKDLTHENWEQKIMPLFKRFYPTKEEQTTKRQELLFFVGERCLSRVVAWLDEEKKENESNRDIIEKAFTRATENFTKAVSKSVEEIVPKYNAIMERETKFNSSSSGKHTGSGQVITWWQERRNFGLRQLADYLTNRKGDLLSGIVTDQKDRQLAFIDRYLVIIYNKLMQHGTADEEKIYYEELKLLVSSKSYLPEEDKEVSIENKLLSSLLSVNQKKDSVQQDKIELMIQMITQQRDLQAVVEMLSKLDLSLRDVFFTTQIKNLVKIVKENATKLALSTEDILSLFRSTTVASDPANNFVLKVLGVEDDNEPLLDVSDLRVLYIRSLLDNETLDDNLRATYALALCKLYIEYLWTIVPRTCLSPDMRVPAGQEPGLIGKLRREFFAFCSSPTFRDLADASILEAVNSCMTKLREAKSYEKQIMHLLEERIVICKHFKRYREAIFIIYFLLQDEERAIAYCFRVLKAREKKEYYYEGSSNPFNLWIEMCFTGLSSKAIQDMSDQSSVPSRLWDSNQEFALLVQLGATRAKQSATGSLSEKQPVQERVSVRIQLNDFLTKHRKTAIRLMNLYGRYIDVRWEEEGGHAAEATSRTIFDLIPKDIPCSKLQDFLTKIVRKQHDVVRTQKLRMDNLIDLQTTTRLQRAQLEARKKVINDKTRCAICKNDILVGYNSSDVNLYPDLQLVHTRCAKDYDGKPFPPYVHAKTLVDQRYRPIGIDDVVTVEKLENPEPSKYFL